MAKQVWKFEPTSRWVRATLQGQTIADSKRAMLMLESRGEQDYYFPQEDVNFDHLTPTALQTHCPYKGFASYYNLTINGDLIENAVWSYPDPIPEAPKLKNTIAFWPEKDKRIRIFVDGELV